MKSTHKKNLILVDADGVLLDWEFAFSIWMEEHGYVFHCITSLSTDVNAQRLREMNLRKLFGRTAFEGVTCLATGAAKNSALEPYADSMLWWIEDKPENADLGHNMGLQSMLMEHGHNMHHECPYPIVKNWREIYEIITS